MSHTVHTIRLHRVLKAPPQRVYQAFTTAAALAKWLPPHGYICEVPEFDARVGGRYRMAFVNLSTGGRSGFGGEFLTWSLAGWYAIPTASTTRNCPAR